MNDKVMRMAREAGFDVVVQINAVDGSIAHLTAFEALVRADERDACAKVCDDFEIPKNMQGAHPDYLDGKEMAASQLANAIRARGNK